MDRARNPASLLEQQQIQRLLQNDAQQQAAELQQVVVDNSSNSNSAPAVASIPANGTTATPAATTTNAEEPLQIEPVQLFAFVCKVVPAILIPLLLFTYEYYMGFLMGLWLFVVTLSTNERIKQQVALKVCLTIVTHIF